MKPDIDKKFDSLRNAPTEFSREQVESIIKGLPTAPAASLDTTNWTSWFSLNNLLIVGFVGALGAGLFLMNKVPSASDALAVKEVAVQTPPETTKNMLATIEAEERIPEVKTEEKETTVKSERVETALVNSASQTKKVEVGTLPKKTSVQQKVKEEVVEIAVQKTTESEPPLEVKPTITSEPKESQIVLNNQIKPVETFTKPSVGIAQQTIKTDPNAVPDLTNGEMRRLKKNLFKNLMDDKLILNTWKAIEIELPGDEIIVDGKVIDQSLFNKYSLLTKKVGWGPDRKIKFDDEYIKVGDFTATGFRGSGFGTFRTTPKRHKPDEAINRESLVLKKEREVKKEQRELDAFAQTLLDTSVGKRRGRRNVMEANLKQKKCKKLHKELYEMLLEDRLIETKVDYVLVEISKNKIYINVLELNEVLYEKYSELFDSYKIKPGPRRQIRMSKHTIRIGDFSRGSFTGTSLILN